MPVIATFTATVPAPDGTGGGIVNLCTIVFSDVTTGYSETKVYAFPATNTVAANRAVVQADLNARKAQVAAATTLASFVGTVLT